MKGRTIRWVVFFLGSEMLGVLLAELFFGVFRKTVPPAVLTSFNQATAHLYFLMYGLLSGLLVFVWSLLWVGVWGRFATRKS